MAYLQSHQALATHPKTRKAARRAGVSIPTMIGHLHLLWYWALDHAPHGDLSRFDPDDLADAAGWEDDPDTFVNALTDCGPGDSFGFLEPDGMLHDWDDYGGKYGKRVDAARKAAAARWQPDGNANAMPPHTDGNATASDAHAKGNAEERRGEERNQPTPVGDGKPSFATRLADEFRSDGWEPPDGASLYESFHALLDESLERKPQAEHRNVTMGLIACYVEKAGVTFTSEARDHTARLVGNYPASEVLRAWGEAVKWGAGIGDKHAADPKSMSKYATSVLTGKAA